MRDGDCATGSSARAGKVIVSSVIQLTALMFSFRTRTATASATRDKPDYHVHA
jgi:hypothetical protein